MVIDALTGRETWRASSANFNVIVCPTEEQKRLTGALEEHIGLAANRKRGITQLNRVKAPAFIGLKDDLGVWSECRFDVPEGTILKGYGMCCNYGKPQKNAAIYVRLREGAALREIRIRLLCESRSRHTHAYLKGHFDVLSLDEVMRHGVECKPQFQFLSNPDRIERTYECVVIVPESAPVSPPSRPARAAPGVSVARPGAIPGPTPVQGRRRRIERRPRED